mmetsp:Transcript_49790/g.160986  ORF Transcript_49790/g.160986 Transcript_49790/m.160986 type:complete len:265 (+) Transcript_49790:1961-2755(+)
MRSNSVSTASRSTAPQEATSLKIARVRALCKAADSVSNTQVLFNPSASSSGRASAAVARTSGLKECRRFVDGINAEVALFDSGRDCDETGTSPGAQTCTRRIVPCSEPPAPSVALGVFCDPASSPPPTSPAPPPPVRGRDAGRRPSMRGWSGDGACAGAGAGAGAAGIGGPAGCSAATGSATASKIANADSEPAEHSLVNCTRATFLPDRDPPREPPREPGGVPTPFLHPVMLWAANSARGWAATFGKSRSKSFNAFLDHSFTP